MGLARVGGGDGIGGLVEEREDDQPIARLAAGTLGRRRRGERPHARELAVVLAPVRRGVQHERGARTLGPLVVVRGLVVLGVAEVPRSAAGPGARVGHLGAPTEVVRELTHERHHVGRRASPHARERGRLGLEAEVHAGDADPLDADRRVGPRERSLAARAGRSARDRLRDARCEVDARADLGPPRRARDRLDQPRDPRWLAVPTRAVEHAEFDAPPELVVGDVAGWMGELEQVDDVLIIGLTI